jgi:hypothetical protein
MRYLGPWRFRGATGVRANGDNNYYHPERAGEHDKNHNGKELLRAYRWSTFFIPPTTRLAANPQGDVKEMRYVQHFAISVMSLASLILVSACGTTSTSKETTTTYVPAPPAQVVVQAPAEAPPPPTTTTSTSSDRTSDSTTSQPGTGTENTTSSHHSESTTVTPSN